MPMKAEVKEKWVKALRSRQFKQGAGSLKRETVQGKLEYCCLGVLHEVDGGKWHKGISKYSTGTRRRASSSHGKLNGKFKRGLTLEESSTLMKMNDEDGKKFYQIANWIEKNIQTKN